MRIKKDVSSLFISAIFAALVMPPVSAQESTLPPSEEFPTSPVRRIERQETISGAAPPPPGFRSIDGSGNNIQSPEMGAVHVQLQRWVNDDYADNVSALAGADRPSARAVSQAVFAQSGDHPNELEVTDYIWQWGQFLDHDLSLTEGTDPAEAADIAVPSGDPWFDPTGLGTVVIPFNRSIYDQESGTGSNNPRQQINEITAWIDASNVYGSDDERALALRALDGTGRLAVSDGDFLPYNTSGLPNAGGTSPTLFLAGDVRANEQVGLAAMHTLFVREHNRLADELRAENPQWTGEEIYQRARRIVGAQMQVITYREFIPALLGPGALRPYQGYRDEVDASIANIFSTAAYRFGHSTLSATVLRLEADGTSIAEGPLALRDAFFQPQRLVEEGGISPVLRGLASQISQAVDSMVIDDLRNFLFGPPGSGGFDLVSLNIQRGRDHGLPSYNRVRQAFGRPPAQDFDDISSDPEVEARLRSAYADVDDVDLWVGCLAEDRRGEGLVGDLLFRIMKRQFEALRDGDRFWYERVLNGQERQAVERTKLSDIIRRNTAVGDELQDDVFHLGASPTSMIFSDGFEDGEMANWGIVFGAP